MSNIIDLLAYRNQRLADRGLPEEEEDWDEESDEEVACRPIREQILKGKTNTISVLGDDFDYQGAQCLLIRQSIHGDNSPNLLGVQRDWCLLDDPATLQGLKSVAGALLRRLGQRKNPVKSILRKDHGLRMTLVPNWRDPGCQIVIDFLKRYPLSVMDVNETSHSDQWYLGCRDLADARELLRLLTKVGCTDGKVVAFTGDNVWPLPDPRDPTMLIHEMEMSTHSNGLRDAEQILWFLDEVAENADPRLGRWKYVPSTEHIHHCGVCQAAFLRKDYDTWKTLCIPCWKRKRGIA